MIAALHPPLAAFPYVLLTVIVLVEIFLIWKPIPGAEKLVYLLLGFGVLATAATFFSGYPTSEQANQTFIVADEAISWHHNLGRLLLFMVVPCAALRWVSVIATQNTRAWSFVYRVMLVLCLGLAVTTGYFGGQLVFEHGAGVRAKIVAPGVP